MKRTAGFTLIELMMTLALAAIILAFGVPSFTDLVRNNRLISTHNDLVTAINVARSEAVKRGTPVSVCISTDQSSCAGGNNWESGWIVFEDSDSDGVVDAADTIVRVQQPYTSVTIRTVDFADTNSLTFRGNGFLLSEDNGTFIVCDSRGVTSAKALNVSALGRVSPARDTDGDGTVNDEEGGDEITCP